MKNKNAKEICTILPFLLSPDYEAIALGFSLLRELPLIKNLNKHYKCEVYIRSDAFSRFPHLNFGFYRDAEFTKSLLFNTYATTQQYYTTAQIVLTWLRELIEGSFSTDGGEKRARNYNLFADYGNWSKGNFVVTLDQPKKSPRKRRSKRDDFQYVEDLYRQLRLENLQSNQIDLKFDPLKI